MSKLTELAFINLNGQPVSLEAQKQRKATPDVNRVYHKGYRVEGFSAEHIESCRLIYEKERADAAKSLRELDPWSDSILRRNFRAKPVRSKPYAIASAAQECAKLAEKAGWRFVVVVELKKGQEPASLF